MNTRTRAARHMGLVATVILCLGGGSRAQDGYQFEQLLALGDPIPGCEGCELDFDFEPGDVNNAGDVVFGADICRRSGETCEEIGEGIFLRTGLGELRPLARAGEPAPGGGVFNRAFRGPPSINDRGDVAFTFEVEGEDPVVPAGLYVYYQETGDLKGPVLPGQPAPCGRTFVKVMGNPKINNLGEVVFAAWVTDADINPGDPPEVPDDDRRIGGGVFLLRANGEVEAKVCPGDPAPGGGTFDFAHNPSINDRGDIAFGAHVQGEECLALTDLLCTESVYLRKASGEIISLAHQGDPAPGGGTFRLAFGSLVNEGGDVVFIGDLTPSPGFGQDLGLFLYAAGSGAVTPLGRPGDPVPGGGEIETLAFFVGAYDVDRCSRGAFTATLTSSSLDIDGDGELEPDQGLFISKGGTLEAVVRSGEELPGVGTLAALLPPAFFGFFPRDFPYPWIGCSLNDAGQVLFQGGLTDGKGVLILASPRGGEPCAQQGSPFVRGDTNADGSINITDGIFVLRFLFLSDEAPPCREAADTNDDDEVNLTDGIYILNFLFTGGPAPPAPTECSAVQGVECALFPACT